MKGSEAFETCRLLFEPGNEFQWLEASTVAEPSVQIMVAYQTKA